jgi:hypothetical protein
MRPPGDPLPFSARHAVGSSGRQWRSSRRPLPLRALSLPHMWRGASLAPGGWWATPSWNNVRVQLSRAPNRIFLRRVLLRPPPDHHGSCPAQAALSVCPEKLSPSRRTGKLKLPEE